MQTKNCNYERLIMFKVNLIYYIQKKTFKITFLKVD